MERTVLYSSNYSENCTSLVFWASASRRTAVKMSKIKGERAAREGGNGMEKKRGSPQIAVPRNCNLQVFWASEGQQDSSENE